jgi:hypothetical protein
MRVGNFLFISALTCVAIGSVRADTINWTLIDDGSLFAPTTFTLKTAKNADKANWGHSRFASPNPLDAILDPLVLTDYLSALPLGATLTGASIEFSSAFGSLTTIVTPTTPVEEQFYTLPAGALGASLEASSAKLTSGSVLATGILSGADLFANGFASQLLSGADLTLTWSQPVKFEFHHAHLAKETDIPCEECAENFDVSAGATWHREAILHLTYASASMGRVSQVPEPGSAWLLGSGLFGIALVLRRRSTSAPSVARR